LIIGATALARDATLAAEDTEHFAKLKEYALSPRRYQKWRKRKHIVQPRSAAAADRIPLGFTVGFEVDAVSATSQDLKEGGWLVVQPPKTEPWGQTTSRFLSPSGALCEVSETPHARRITQSVRANAEPE